MTHHAAVITRGQERNPSPKRQDQPDAAEARAANLPGAAAIPPPEEAPPVALVDTFQTASLPPLWTDRPQACLLNHYADSQERRFRKFYWGLELGQRRPSVLLAEMRRLAGDRIDQAGIKTLWLDRLPRDIHAMLIADEDVPLDSEISRSYCRSPVQLS
ncbi:hypothetical protein PV328_011711 [Microctonus aethiopoides]|uniref:Uncharacterized protein n=1 Tax=Microctonus aethiopoides TaxID=144406 RepID=A0AA39ESR8_9HYME|nr:hypothetical protein PV328_011711 [Microctonus aethiopoides]